MKLKRSGVAPWREKKQKNMTPLLRTEWLKMKKYNAFWWIMGLTALSYPAINYIFYYIIYSEIRNNPTEGAQLIKMAIGNPYQFPDVWHTVAYASSIFTFIPAVVVIMLITNEYSYRTHRQNIIDGWSRSQFVTSKLLDVLIITSIITVLCFLISIISGFASHDRLIRDTWGQVEFVGYLSLQTFSQLSIAFLFGFLIKKAFIALGAFLFYYIVLENILVPLFKFYVNDIGKFLPLEMSDRMIPLPPFLGRLDPNYQSKINAIPQYVLMTIILTALVWFICYWINNRRDLK